MSCGALPGMLVWPRVVPNRFLLLLYLVLVAYPWPSSTQPTSATGVVAEGEVPDPIAVMPFNNLNQDPELAWLAAGMSEAMLSDLRSEGMRVVMRDTLSTAMAEMALQDVRVVDESSAARVGKLVGARTMVFGGFQTAAGRIRITARFVEVETSLVLDAAMVTGPITDILSLQDEIVSKLLGREVRPSVAVVTAEPGRPAKRQAATGSGTGADRPAGDEPSTAADRTTAGSTRLPEAGDREKSAISSRSDRAAVEQSDAVKHLPPAEEASARAPRDGEATLAAYRSFSMSLSATTTAQQRSLLEEAMNLDPEFHYARHALADLEQRMEHYRKVLRERLSAQQRDLREKLEKAEYEHHPMELMGYFGMLFGQYMTNSLWYTALQDLDWLEEVQWPEEASAMLEDHIAYYRFMILNQLKRTDEALRLGEDYLRERTDGQFYQQIEREMSRIIDSRRDMLDKLEELPEALDEIEEEQEKIRERFESAESSFEEVDEQHRRLLAELSDLEEETAEHRRATVNARAAERRRDMLQRNMQNAREAHGRLVQRRCVVLMRHKAYRQAAQYCGEAADEVHSLGIADPDEMSRSLRYQQLIAYFHSGDFRSAIDAGQVITEGLEPRDTWVRNVESMLRSIPADTP